MANDRHGVAHAEEIDDMMGYGALRRQLVIGRLKKLPINVAQSKSKKIAVLELTPRLS
jgi:hypothetical protein